MWTDFEFMERTAGISQGSKEPKETARRWFVLGAVLLVVLTTLVYIPALRAGFIWDDDDHLTNNPAMLSVGGLRQIWSSLAVSRYYPLTLMSFWIEHRLWGLRPLPYHAVNIALHAVNALLLWALLRRLRIPGSWLAVAVWAVHPVNVETVAWITELKNTQSEFFFLSAVLLFLRFEDRFQPRDYVLALACGMAAMLSKPSTVILPLVMLLCAWWQSRRWTRNDCWRVMPLVAFGVGMSLLTVVEQRHLIVKEGAPEWTLSAAQRLVLAGRAVWFYAGKLLWPANICFLYPRWELRVDSVVAWLPLIGLALAAGTLWHFRRTNWACAATFGLGCFVAALLPVLGFLDIYFFQFSYVADHFQYLAGPGLIALVVGAGVTVCRRAGRLGRAGGVLSGVIVLLMLAASTWTQAHVYRDMETLWRDTLATNPDAWMAHNNLGIMLLDRGRTKEAVAHFEQALRIKPDYADAHYSLALAFIRSGKVTDAIEQYDRVLEINPNRADAHCDLGLALQQAGRSKEAIDHYQAALRIEPHYAEPHYDWGMALWQSGRFDEAAAQYEQALRIEPDFAEAHGALGAAFQRAGRLAEAVQHYEQALRIKPDYAEAHNNLGNVLVRLGDRAEAIKQYEEALRIMPDFAEGHYNLAVTLIEANRIPEATRHLERALQINPDFTRAQNALARLRAGP